MFDKMPYKQRLRWSVVMKYWFGVMVLAKKPFSKVEVELRFDAMSIIANERFKHNGNLDDLKHELLNNGYKIDWDVYQFLMKLKWF